MSQWILKSWARRLLLDIANDIKVNTNKYYSAGKWFDEFCNVNQFWERRKQELLRLKNQEKNNKTNKIEQFKEQYLEMMIQLGVYIPYDSMEFNMMIAKKAKTSLPKINKDKKKKLDGLLSVLDMNKKEQDKWIYDHVPEYKRSNVSLGAFAFVLQKIFNSKMSPTNSPPINIVRKHLEQWRKIDKEPALYYRFLDALDYLFYTCWGKDFLTDEDASHICLSLWLLSDPTISDKNLGITKFENWPWDKGLRCRSNAYYETLLWNQDLGKRWFSLGLNAWEIMSTKQILIKDRTEENEVNINGEILNDSERNIIEALGTNTLTGEDLSAKAGYPYNSNFKSTLSSLRKRKIIGNKAPGYFIESRYHFLLNKKKQSQD